VQNLVSFRSATASSLAIKFISFYSEYTWDDSDVNKWSHVGGTFAAVYNVVNFRIRLQTAACGITHQSRYPVCKYFGTTIFVFPHFNPVCVQIKHTSNMAARYDNNVNDVTAPHDLWAILYTQVYIDAFLSTVFSYVAWFGTLTDTPLLIPAVSCSLFNCVLSLLLYKRCSDVIDVTDITRRHVGGIFSTNEDCVKCRHLRLSILLSTLLPGRPCISTVI